MSNGQYTITLDHERGLVHVIAQGELFSDLGDELISKAREQAAENQYNIICDVRQSRTRVPLVDWYFLPRRLAAYRSERTRAIRTAIVIAGKEETVYRFFETVTRNLGMNIRVFLREEEALEWLQSMSKADE